MSLSRKCYHVSWIKFTHNLASTKETESTNPVEVILTELIGWMVPSRFLNSTLWLTVINTEAEKWGHRSQIPAFSVLMWYNQWCFWNPIKYYVCFSVFIFLTLFKDFPLPWIPFMFRCFQVLGQKILTLRYREVYQLYLDGYENFSCVISTVAKTCSEITVRKEEH